MSAYSAGVVSSAVYFINQAIWCSERGQSLSPPKFFASCAVLNVILACAITCGIMPASSIGWMVPRNVFGGELTCGATTAESEPMGAMGPSPDDMRPPLVAEASAPMMSSISFDPWSAATTRTSRPTARPRMGRLSRRRTASRSMKRLRGAVPFQAARAFGTSMLIS
eukprot:COSAG02_NODE_22562_length_748_cov_0.861325_2_plen_166_part_01